ncbi:hypothetical protein EO244_05810 [Ancylomarina salipaludis]|uniref:Uncharacterized protein n=1 Tax=Ancylomarina salipaludis TaxID=2501299 RepID=A0A4V1N097_9BACT|nr:hypothetical protein [Ancylomarina salipaludis]RXQ95823.1 hypothetical protein EO244_05810 [Ancylomarina salipaludis]
MALCLMLVFAACSHHNGRSIEDIRNASFDKKQISRGDNNPNRIVYEDDVDALMVSLFYGKTLKEINRVLGWDDSKMTETTNLLIENGMLSEKNGVYTPTVFVLPLKEGLALMEESNSIAKEIADGMIAQLGRFKALHDKMDISKQYSFHDLSFFYLSDIVLDMGQIRDVERLYLKKERPLRNGKQYYFSIMEKDTTRGEEALGIYGNQGLVNNDSIYIGVYGNTRFQKADWDDYKNKEMYCFSKNDFNILFNEFNKQFLPTLIDILEKNRAEFQKLYIDYGYSGKISFEEFFIWYYHLIYTEATNQLIKKGVIKKPESGVLYYQLKH